MSSESLWTSKSSFTERNKDRPGPCRGVRDHRWPRAWGYSRGGVTKIFIIPGGETGSEGFTAQNYSTALNTTWTGERLLSASPSSREGPFSRGHHLRRTESVTRYKSCHKMTVSQGCTSPCWLPGQAEQSVLGARTCHRLDLTTIRFEIELRTKSHPSERIPSAFSAPASAGTWPSGRKR